MAEEYVWLEPFSRAVSPSRLQPRNHVYLVRDGQPATRSLCGRMHEHRGKPNKKVGRCFRCEQLLAFHLEREKRRAVGFKDQRRRR